MLILSCRITLDIFAFPEKKTKKQKTLRTSALQIEIKEHSSRSYLFVMKLCLMYLSQSDFMWIWEDLTDYDTIKILHWALEESVESIFFKDSLPSSIPVLDFDANDAIVQSKL